MITKNKLRKNYLINRDLSWLRFNSRVLLESKRTTNPLLERVKFLAIAANNLDEFFEIRIAGLEQQKESNQYSIDPSGYTPKQILVRVYRVVSRLVKELYDTWNHVLVPVLEKEGVHIKQYKTLVAKQKEYIDKIFLDQFYPILTPIKVDPAHPFPWIVNKALCIAAIFETSNPKRSQIGVVTVPSILPEAIKLPSVDGQKHSFVLLSEIIRENLDVLFKGFNIREKVSFRVTRNSNLYLNEEEAQDILKAIETELHNRKKGDVVRLEIKKGASSELINMLLDYFHLDASQVHTVDGPVNLYRLMSLYEMIDDPVLKFPRFSSYEPDWFLEKENIFQRIQKGDFILHHPYETFKPVVHMLEMAATDPKVLAIKMTLYRTDTDSPLMHSLINAAKNGKEVTVVVELKARFDEASNVAWAKHLLDNGVNVVYGILGLKTHCKLLLIIRKESKDKLIKYAHIGTGNYNEKTAALYADLSLFTNNIEVTEDVLEVFNFLTSQSKEPRFNKLWISPSFMLKRFLTLIEKETLAAQKNKKAKIIFKVNALQEPEIIEAIHKAAEAGVEILGIVRGICCFRYRPTEFSNIKIKSIVGRYLEHSRIFYFHNSKPYRLFISSADWMPRNLKKRVEVAVPIVDPKIEKHILTEILECQLKDNFDAQEVGRTWKTPKEKNSQYFSCQEAFMEKASEQ